MIIEGSPKRRRHPDGPQGSPTSLPAPQRRPETAGRLAVEYRATGGLKLDDRNPRAHRTAQVRQIARSIEAFGFNVPVLIDREDNVVAGHGRVLACRLLGRAEVPTIRRLDHLAPAQARAFMVADNRLAETSAWDERLLAETLRELSLAELDFDLGAIGFEVAEIDLRIEGLQAPAEGNPDPADAPCPPPAGAAVSRPGDLWMLGRHRLLCGSALEEAAYAQLMAGRRAAMVFTDPPYNVPIAGHAGGLGAVRHREFAMASGEMDAAEFTALLGTALGLAARHARDGSLHFVCMDWRHIPELLAAGGGAYAELLAAGGGAYAELKNLCVWAKDNAGMGSLYRSQHELVFVFKACRAAHRNNVALGRHGRHRSNLWSYSGVNSFGRRGEEGDLLALHPTVKPVRLVADAILDCTARGDLVLDPFLGSGTTLIAAERVGRRCNGLELDPLYVDTVVRRWQALTGDAARHAASGDTFDRTAAAGQTAAAAPACGEARHGA